MKKIFFLLIVLIIESLASGWNDYRIKLDENYSIIRYSTQGENLFYHNYEMPKKDNVGQICGYETTREYIFLEKYRLKERNSSKGNSYHQRIDYDKRIFYIVNKKDNSYVSFEDEKKFDEEVMKLVHKKVKWIYPSNPNPNHPIPWIFYLLELIFNYGLYVLILIFSFVGFKVYRKKSN